MIRRRGMSILEALVGMVILGVSGTAVVAALRQSAREVDTTSDATLAMGLSQRLLEESLQGMQDNPHLGPGAPWWGTGKAPIRERGHVRFQGLEDTVAPWGRIEGDRDLAIDGRDPSLFRLYRDFDLDLSVRDQAPAPGSSAPSHLLDVSIQFECPGPKSTPRTFKVPFLLARAQIAPEQAPPVAQDLPGLDEAIRKAFYPSASLTSLPAVVSSLNADLVIVRDLGSIVVVLQSCAEGTAAMDRELTRRLGPGGVLPTGAVELAQLASLRERRTALAWRTLLYCREPASRLSVGFSRAQIGGLSGPATPFLSAVLRRALTLTTEIEQGCALVLADYLALRRTMPTTPVRAFRQLCVERKVLEMSKLRALISGGRELDFVREWIGTMGAYYKGRNGSVEAFLEREAAGAVSIERLRELHPVEAERVSACEAATDHVVRLRDRLP